jgi:hypothetical protein
LSEILDIILMLLMIGTAFALGAIPRDPRTDGVMPVVLNHLQPISSFALGYFLVVTLSKSYDIPLNEGVLVLLGATPGLLGLLIMQAITKKASAPTGRLSDLEAKAALALFTRYRDLIVERQAEMAVDVTDCAPEHLIKLCNEVIENHQRYPFDKLCRWMGFVQGVLAAQGIIQVETEREFSRPLLHAIHNYVPPTFGPETKRV